MPAHEAKEAADVTRRYRSRELMLALGGLADARPMTCNITGYKQYMQYSVTMFNEVRGYEAI